MSSFTLALVAAMSFLHPHLASLLALAVPMRMVRDTNTEGPGPVSTSRVVVGALLFSFLLLFVLGAFHVATKRRAPRPQPGVHLPLTPYRSQATGANPNRDRGAIAIDMPAPSDSSASTSEISLHVSEPSSRGSPTPSLAFPPALVTADQFLATHRHAYSGSSASGSEHSSGSSAGGSAPPSPSSPLLRISSIEVTATRVVQN